MAEENLYVVGIGEILWDVFPGNREKLGGAPAIFAYHAAQMGFTGMIISAVGSDLRGQRMKKILKSKYNLDYRLPEIPTRDTGISEVSIADPNRPTYKIAMDAAWCELPYDDEYDEIAAKCGAVYYGPLADYSSETTRASVRRFLNHVPSDCYKIYDVNLRYDGEVGLFDEQQILDGISRCSVLKVNLEELNVLSNISGLDPLSGENHRCKELMKRFPKIKMLLLTMGEDGSSVFIRDGEKSKDVLIYSFMMPTSVKNTVGAGDALAGAFIGGLLNGRSYYDAYEYAVRRSVEVCRAGDCMTPIKTKEIFVSYSWQDKVVVEYFLNRFKEKGWYFWLDDQRVPLGESFEKRINEEISRCGLVLFFSSRNSNESANVLAEIKMARSKRKPIIPVLLDDAAFHPDFPTELKKIRGVDFSMVDKGVEALMGRIEGEIK